MSLALNHDIDWSREDPRVKPCVVDFLLTRMRKYASTHQWRFSEADFDTLRCAALIVALAPNHSLLYLPLELTAALAPAH